MPNLRGSEWLIIILLLVLLFGAKRLPDAARSMGRSLRIFKAETKGLVDEGAPAENAPAPNVQQAPAAPIAPAQPTTTPAVPPAPPQAAPPSDDQRIGGSLTPQPPTQA